MIYNVIMTCLARVTSLSPCWCPDAGRERSQSADPLPLPGPEGGEGRRPHDGRDGPQVHSKSSACCVHLCGLTWLQATRLLTDLTGVVQEQIV